MRQIDYDELKQLIIYSKDSLKERADNIGRDVKIYLHWSAGHYGSLFSDYHINIDKNGEIYVSTNDFSEVLNHTYRRNTGSIGIALACCAGATSNDLGDEPPTSEQIDAMAKSCAIILKELGLTPNDITTQYVLTHGEAADNLDGVNASEQYGPQTTVERWDLQFLGTSESPYYTADYDDASTGGNVLRGKIIWYMQQMEE